MTHDPHDLAGPYVLDALGDTERRRFERHLSGCTTCADET
ncbi:zf-HC2 domain-containing protein, partial [Actinomadura sp. KC216]